MTVRAGVVLLAGGSGSRMQTDVNKVYLQIQGRNMIEHSFATLAGSALVSRIVVVVRHGEQNRVQHLLDGPSVGPVVQITFGGATRHLSERAGIVSLRPEIESGQLDVVAVHDGARPFLSVDLLDRTLAEAALSGGALPACPVEDILYSFDGETFIDSSQYVWSQTPQAFSAQALLAAHDAAAATNFEGVDTAEVVQTFSDQAITVVPGEPSNIKVTYQGDLASLEADVVGRPDPPNAIA